MFRVVVKGLPLEYCPLTGQFFWLRQRGGRREGDPAGSLNKSLGYYQIRVNGKLHYAHRLAFIAMTGDEPKGFVDHINRDKSDNRWENLRDVGRSENLLNAKTPKDNTSGHKGIYFNRRDNLWVFRVAGKVSSYHKTLEEAVSFKLEWSKEQEFYHG